MIRGATHNCCSPIARAALLLIHAIFVVAACGGPEPGPDEQLLRWVDAGQNAAETKQRADMLDLISPAYTDSNGYDREEIGNILRLYFLRQNSISLLTSVDDIRVYGGSAAEIDLTVGMAGTKDGVFGFSADAYRFRLELELDGDDWLLISARWAELGKELH